VSTVYGKSLKHYSEESVENNTVIEYRNYVTGKLITLVFDETEFYIQRVIDGLQEDGHFDFFVLENPKNYKLCYE